jgi:hypothetical protein
VPTQGLYRELGHRAQRAPLNQERTRPREVNNSHGWAQALAMVSGARETGANSLNEDRALELREHAAHPEHGLPGRRAGVQPLLVQVQVYACHTMSLPLGVGPPK